MSATACFGAAPMGWNSWNSFANIVNFQIVQQQAKTLASNGMKGAGYEYVVIDEGWWLGERDASGNIVWSMPNSGLLFSLVRKIATWPISPPTSTAWA